MLKIFMWVFIVLTVLSALLSIITEGDIIGDNYHANHIVYTPIGRLFNWGGFVATIVLFAVSCILVWLCDETESALNIVSALSLVAGMTIVYIALGLGKTSTFAFGILLFVLSYASLNLESATNAQRNFRGKKIDELQQTVQNYRRFFDGMIQSDDDRKFVEAQVKKIEKGIHNYSRGFPAQFPKITSDTDTQQNMPSSTQDQLEANKEEAFLLSQMPISSLISPSPAPADERRKRASRHQTTINEEEHPMPHPDYLRTRLSTEDVKCLKGLGQKTLHIKLVGDEEGDFIPRPPNICDSGDGSDECHRCVATLFYRLRDEYQESKQKEPR